MITIKKVNDHYAIYKDGKFQCSADTRHEAEKEKEEIEREEESKE